MCCLFGILDYQGRLSLKERQKILKVLSTECEARGTDATGIAYFVGTHLSIQKAPKPAHRMRFQLSSKARYIMGHTRLTTQGSAKKVYNNHPFGCRTMGTTFALAHNGVLHNEESLRRDYGLPKTRIETDSYVAAQLLEQLGRVSFTTLQKMAEAVRGTFTFTVLDEYNNLYIVKGDNPMCICHFPDDGFYLYASTQDILFSALCKLRLTPVAKELVPIRQGDILRIAADGSLAQSRFNDNHLLISQSFLWPYSGGWQLEAEPTSEADLQAQEEYLTELLDFAEANGVHREDLQILLEAGYDVTDLEELIFNPDWLAECLEEVLGVMYELEGGEY